jgi:hypothetical protein
VRGTASARSYISFSLLSTSVSKQWIGDFGCECIIAADDVRFRTLNTSDWRIIRRVPSYPSIPRHNSRIELQLMKVLTHSVASLGCQVPTNDAHSLTGRLSILAVRRSRGGYHRGGEKVVPTFSHSVSSLLFNCVSYPVLPVHLPAIASTSGEFMPPLAGNKPALSEIWTLTNSLLTPTQTSRRESQCLLSLPS